MTTPDPWLLILCIATLLLVLGATSGLVNSRLWMSEPLVCSIAGVLLGPQVFALAELDPGRDPAARSFLLEAARITLAIAVLGAAIQLPRGWLRRHWRGLAVALGPGMLLMWGTSTLITAASFQLSLLTCLLVGAIVTPTDPVLSAPVVTGRLAKSALPADLRYAIAAESGANDGLAQPIVMLPLFLILEAHGYDVEHALSDWGIKAVIVELGGTVVFGLVIGLLARRCMHWASEHADAERASLLTIALALALATLAGLELLGGNGILGAFIAGTVLNEAYDEDYVEHQEHFNEAISRFFDLPVTFLLGVAAPWQAWLDLGWRGLGFVIGMLLLRRIPAWLMLHRLMPWTRASRDALFAGWFGPVGTAAIFYACMAQDMTGNQDLWPIVSLAAAASIVAHGVTGTHLSIWLGRTRDAEDRA